MLDQLVAHRLQRWPNIEPILRVSDNAGLMLGGRNVTEHEPELTNKTIN